MDNCRGVMYTDEMQKKKSQHKGEWSRLRARMRQQDNREMWFILDLNLLLFNNVTCQFSKFCFMKIKTVCQTAAQSKQTKTGCVWACVLAHSNSPVSLNVSFCFFVFFYQWFVLDVTSVIIPNSKSVCLHAIYTPCIYTSQLLGLLSSSRFILFKI